MAFLLDNIRRFVLVLSAALAVSLYFFSGADTNLPKAWAELGKLYADTAVILLYITLLATPLTQQFPNLPYRILYIKARRAIGVSAFFYGLMHGSISFFVVLGGWSGLGELPALGIFAVTASSLALLILALLAATSFDYMARLLGPRWKILHRFVYIAAVLIVFHAVIMGSLDFLYIPLVFLIALEATRVMRYIRRRRSLPETQKSPDRNSTNLGL